MKILIILIFLLTFTNFELSGQYIEGNVFAKLKKLTVDTHWNIFFTLYICMYSDICERKILPRDNFFLKRLNLVGLEREQL